MNKGKNAVASESLGEPTNDPNLPEGATLTPSQVRYLWIAVIIMGILLIVGFFVVVGKIIYEGSQMGKDPAAKAPAVSQPSVPVSATSALSEDILLPAAPGSEVKSFTLDGGRMAVHITSPSGEEIAIVDLGSGKVLSRVKVQPQ